MIVGNSAPINTLKQQIARVAPTNARVLITGENGTGKELVAQAIHQQSARKDKPFITLNCGAIPDTLIESELFGYVKGAFTGATAGRPGKFEAAHGGTLFLDEIGDMPLLMQVKLLRALQTSEITRIGATAPVRLDVRVLAATNKDLGQEISAGNFRQDLFYRLNVINLRTPALRDRIEDLPLLIEHFLPEGTHIAPGALSALQQHAWEGNVRELQNVVERLVVLGSTPGKIVSTDVTDFVMPNKVGYRHGTRSAYNKGCRCDECRRANTLGARKRREKLKREKANQLDKSQAGDDRTENEQ